MKRAQALIRLQAVCDKKGWHDLEIRKFSRCWVVLCSPPAGMQIVVQGDTLLKACNRIDEVAEHHR